MIKTLQKLGLTEKESQVYLANLELGPSRVPEIAEKSGIKRTTVYTVIESLMQKGLVSYFKSKKTKKFVAEEPRKLNLFLKEKQNALKQVLPQLEALVKMKQIQPEVRFYKGEKGCLNIYEQSLEVPNSEILFIGSVEDTYKITTTEYDKGHYIPTRLKKKIKFRALFFENKTTQMLKKNNKKELREIKFLPDKYFFPTSMLIFEDKIAMISSKEELIGVTIKSSYLAKMEKQKFQLIWDSL